MPVVGLRPVSARRCLSNGVDWSPPHVGLDVVRIQFYRQDVRETVEPLRGACCRTAAHDLQADGAGTGVRVGLRVEVEVGDRLPACGQCGENVA